MSHQIPRLVVTAGEPAGIGPDLCVQLAQHDLESRITVVADPQLLQQRAALLGLPLQLTEHSPGASPAPQTAGALEVIPVRCQVPPQAGTLNADNARYVLDTLDIAIQGCLTGEFDALVTGPVHKGIINEAGIPFTGHTEYLAQHCSPHGKPQVVMMLATPGLRVALATTHLPLREVSNAITAPRLRQVITTLHRELVSRFGIEQPRILVCGLNPHAGEGGHLGHEELEIITPVLEQLRQQGFNLQGPLSADTLFTHDNLQHADVVLAMYHDQGLPVLKHMGFGKAVNITLGLPIIRTSVDHGTALELAGSGKADPGSLLAAIATAAQMCRHA